MEAFVRSAATTSWIDERLFGPTLPEVDWGSETTYTDGRSVGRGLIVGQEAYRFANFLEATIHVHGNRIISSDFTEPSDMYRSPSFFDIESEPFAVRRSINIGRNAVTFTQLVGCRTRSPEVIAEVIGAGAGAGTGAGLGLIGGGGLVPTLSALGGWFGHKIGREVVEELMVFPPIWSEISLTIDVTGKAECKLIRHSLFPSLCFYRQHDERTGIYQRNSIYDARLILDKWKQQGWGSGNPWSIPNPQGWGDNRRHSSLTSGSRTGSINRNGPVRGSVAASSGSVLGGSTRPGPTAD